MAGVPEKVIDICGVCGGNGTTCIGCDGIPNSGKTYDRFLPSSPNSPLDVECVMEMDLVAITDVDMMDAVIV